MIVNKKSILTVNIITDLILLNGCFLLSAVYAQSWEILISKSYFFSLLVILNILWTPFTSAFKTYDEYSNRSPVTTFLNVFKITITQAVLSVFFIFLFRENLFTRFFIIYFSLSLFIALSIKQVLLRKTLKLLRKKGYNIRNAAIISASSNPTNISEFLQTNPQLGINIVGEIGTKNSLGELSDLENIILNNSIDLLLISSNTNDSEKIKKILRISDRMGIQSYLIPDFSNFISSRFEISFLGKNPIIEFRKNSLDEFQSRLFKRLMDIAISSIVFITLVWWLFPIIIILIRLDSKGSAFFTQPRIGFRNKQFNCYKFRTMTQEASSIKDAIIPVDPNDTRVTALGSFLRKTNIDELPQIINVLKGDMSIVGPRPHSISFDKLYSDMIEEIKLRHRVKPGITGWAQVNGMRGDSPIEEENRKLQKKRFSFDIWYIENWSFGLDIQIILLTIWQMINRKNMGL